MTIKHIESKVDALAKTADAAVATAREQSTQALHAAGEIVAEAETKVQSTAKTIGERMDEAVQKAGHSAHQAADKVVHSAQKVNEAIAHAVKEAAAKAREKVKGH
jgi:uncharacterized protein YoxC